MPIRVTTYDELASQLSETFDSLDGDQKHWIALTGSPGSGKTTVAQAIRQRVPEIITVISMDGYHYYRWQLDAMEDPEEAHARRGSPFTFDAARLVKELQQARLKGTGVFPSFDHNIGDPVEHDVELRSGRQIVIVEGNYLLLDDLPWGSLKKDVFDDTWFLDADIAECRRRVEDRHVRTGLTREEARYRVSSNDGPNAELVRSASLRKARQIVAIKSPINDV
ncbi:MAG: AAA family ATPase [Fuerstiella sp.]|nr:AAA family ATPase [Fuerstiella sp.]